MKTIEFTIHGKFYYYHVLLNVIMTPRHYHPLVASLVGHLSPKFNSLLIKTPLGHIISQVGAPPEHNYFWTFKAPRTHLSFLIRGVTLLAGIPQHSLKSDNKIDPGCVSINPLTLSVKSHAPNLGGNDIDRCHLHRWRKQGGTRGTCPPPLPEPCQCLS